MALRTGSAPASPKPETKLAGGLGRSYMRSLLLALFLAAVVVGPVAAQQEPNPSVPTIVTTGEAEIHRVPDQAFVSVSVETHARLPRDAQKQNADTMNAVQQKLIEAGI